MKMVFGRDREVADWVAARTDGVGDFRPCAAIGVEGMDGLIAGVVYHDYRPEFETIQLSMAADNPMWAKFVPGLLSYPFDQLGVFKAWVAVNASNEHGLKTFKHIGFSHPVILAHQFGRKRHGVILRMLRPDYNRLYGVHHEQEIAISARAA